MHLRTFHPGDVAFGRRHSRPGAVKARATTQAQPTEGAALLTGSSMWVMETGLAAVAIATAILLGVGR